MTVLSETKTEKMKPLVSPDSKLKKSGQSADVEAFANILEFKNKNCAVQKDKLSSLMIANSKALSQTEDKNYSYTKYNESQNKSYDSVEKPYEKKNNENTFSNRNQNEINYNDPNLYINSYSVQKLENLNREKPPESVNKDKSEKNELNKASEAEKIKCSELQGEKVVKTEKGSVDKLTDVSSAIKANTVKQSTEISSTVKANAVDQLKETSSTVESNAAEKLTDISSEVKSNAVDQLTDTSKHKQKIDNKKEEIDSKDLQVISETQEPSKAQEASNVDNNKKVLADVSNLQKSNKETNENLENLKDKPEINFEKDARVTVSENNRKVSEVAKDNTTQSPDNKPILNNHTVQNQKIQKNIEQTEDVKAMVARMSIQDLSKDASNTGKNGTNLNNSNQKQFESKTIGINDIQNNIKSDFSAKLKTEKLDVPQQRSELAKSVLAQINDKVKAEFKQGNKEVTISLKPDNLGKVDIKLTSVNGVLTTQINTENQHVKDIINKGLEALKQNLADQGINVGKMVVQSIESPSPNNNNSQQFSENQQFFDKSNLSNQNQSSGRNSQNSSESLYSGRYEEDFSLETNEINNTSQQKSVNNLGLVDYTI